MEDVRPIALTSFGRHFAGERMKTSTPWTRQKVKASMETASGMPPTPYRPEEEKGEYDEEKDEQEGGETASQLQEMTVVAGDEESK